LSIYSVNICNSVLTSPFISFGVRQDKKRENGADTLDVVASIPSEITQIALY